MDFDEIIKDQMKNVVDQDNLDSLSDYASNLSGGISCLLYTSQAEQGSDIYGRGV